MHDVKAVVSALEEHIMKALRKGNSVRLRDLGSFYPTLRSRGAETEKDFKTEMIKSVNIVFSKSAKMQHGFAVNNPNITFKRTDTPEEEEI